MKVGIIGGGAAGMAAAIAASGGGAQVTLFEKNEKLGKKIYITGKGRCNVTNACTREEFFENVVRNPKFLYSSFSAFDNERLSALLEQSGCALKTERGNRVFPVSDRASDVTKALMKNLSKVSVRLGAEVKSVERSGEGFRISSSDAPPADFDAVVLATGGLSYPATGSTGDGYAFARRFGHTVTELRPALVGMKIEELSEQRRETPLAARMREVREAHAVSFASGELAGLTLKNVRALVRFADGKYSRSEFGELLFTHSGVSGPIVLTLSSFVNREKLAGAKLILDLKPALSAEELDNRLLREFASAKNRLLRNILHTLLPSSLIPLFLEVSGLSGEREANAVTAQERRALGIFLKAFPLGIRSLCGIESGVVTSGGASVSEINPKTLESRLVNGLFFAGELLDADALTGGFNLQIAFSTGWLAGMSAAKIKNS